MNRNTNVLIQGNRSGAEAREIKGGKHRNKTETFPLKPDTYVFFSFSPSMSRSGHEG